MDSYRISFAPGASRAAGRYVVRGFFAPRELPLAMLRALKTREFVLYVGLPLAALAGTYALPVDWQPAAMWIVIAWLLLGAALLLTLGRGEAVAVYSGERLVGGLRLKVSRRRRRLWLAGILVDPDLRGKGMFPALLLAAFRLAESARPLTIEVFAPAHPASRRMVEKYLEGKTTIPVEPGDSIFGRALARFVAEVKALEERGVRYDFEIDRPLLGPGR